MKRFWFACSVLFLLGFLGGCATHEPMSREQYIDYTTKTYSDANPKEIFQAAEKVFLLTDGNDFSFSYTEDSMRASNKWLVYVVLAAANGVDHWQIKTEDVPSGTKVQVQVFTSASTTQATAYGPMQSNIQQGKAPEGPAIFELFWRRLDYVLGRKDDWISCEEMQNIVDRSRDLWGRIPQMCRTGTLDLKPDAVVAWNSQESMPILRGVDLPVAKDSWTKVGEGQYSGSGVYKVPVEEFLQMKDIKL